MHATRLNLRATHRCITDTEPTPMCAALICCTVHVHVELAHVFSSAVFKLTSIIKVHAEHHHCGRKACVGYQQTRINLRKRSLNSDRHLGREEEGTQGVSTRVALSRGHARINQVQDLRGSTPCTSSIIITGGSQSPMFVLPWVLHPLAC